MRFHDYRWTKSGTLLEVSGEGPKDAERQVKAGEGETIVPLPMQDGITNKQWEDMK
jgi:hypothetical protein